MLGIKDHVIALVAVFLALGIGILIGTSFSEDFLISNQREIIEQLEQQLYQAKVSKMKVEEEVKSLQQEKYYWSKLEEYLYSRFIEGFLTGKSIVVISDSLELGKEVNEFIQIAGGEAVLVSLNGGFLEHDIAALSEIFPEASKWEDYGQLLASGLADNFRGGQSKKNVSYLQQQGFLDIEGHLTNTPDAVVIVQVGEEISENLLKIYSAVADRIAKEGIITVGLSDHTNSKLLKYFFSRDICTIDNIHTFFGRVALLEVINGKKGHYGFRQEIATFLPD